MSLFDDLIHPYNIKETLNPSIKPASKIARNDSFLDKLYSAGLLQKESLFKESNKTLKETKNKQQQLADFLAKIKKLDCDDLTLEYWVDNYLVFVHFQKHTITISAMEKPLSLLRGAVNYVTDKEIIFELIKL